MSKFDFIKVGAKVKWNDPEYESLSQEDKYYNDNCVFVVDEIHEDKIDNQTIIKLHLYDDNSNEVECTAQEIEPLNGNDIELMLDISRKEDIKILMYSELSALYNDYFDIEKMVNAIKDDVISDVIECSDYPHFNNDDVKIAIGRVLLKKIYVE